MRRSGRETNPKGKPTSGEPRRTKVNHRRRSPLKGDAPAAADPFSDVPRSPAGVYKWLVRRWKTIPLMNPELRSQTDPKSANAMLADGEPVGIGLPAARRAKEIALAQHRTRSNGRKAAESSVRRAVLIAFVAGLRAFARDWPTTEGLGLMEEFLKKAPSIRLRRSSDRTRWHALLKKRNFGQLLNQREAAFMRRCDVEYRKLGRARQKQIETLTSRHTMVAVQLPLTVEIMALAWAEGLMKQPSESEARRLKRLLSSC